MAARILMITGIMLVGVVLAACGKKSSPEPIQSDHYPRTYPQV